MSPEKRIRVAVIGAGAFGRNHARVYRQLQQEGAGVELAGIVDIDRARAAAVGREFGAPDFGVIEGILGRIDAASVAVPTVEHLNVARVLMEASVDVLIEKPLAASLDEADDIASVAQRTGRVVQVGHLERFNPAVRATVPLLTRPMFFEVHRLSVFTPRSLDIDVILDLMIHDLDIVLSFVGSPVKEIRAVGLPILTPKVDIANVRMEFESGCVANFTASRVSTERVRKLRFFQPQQYISIDYSRQDVMVFTVGAAGAAASPNPGIGMRKPSVVSEEPLHAELRSFLEAVRNRTQPQVPIDDGRRALAVALDVLTEIRAHSRRVGLESVARPANL